MSNPAQPFGNLPTYGYTGHAVTSRNRYMVTVPKLYESTSDPDHFTVFVLDTTFIGPFICKYWHGRDKAFLIPKWNENYPSVSFGKARLKVNRLLPSTGQAIGGFVSVDKEQFGNSNYMHMGISKDGYPNELQPIQNLSAY
ncbi:hypothetical protein ACTXT7_002042 [Hymenolepis weldensis]